MRIKFKYKGIEYSPKNPKNAEKKLKQLGITWDDVEIITEQPKIKETIDYQDPELYVFRNSKTNEVILSIYDNLDLLKEYLDINDYEFIGMQEYDDRGKGKY